MHPQPGVTVHTHHWALLTGWNIQQGELSLFINIIITHSEHRAASQGPFRIKCRVCADHREGTRQSVWLFVCTFIWTDSNATGHHLLFSSVAKCQRVVSTRSRSERCAWTTINRNQPLQRATFPQALFNYCCSCWVWQWQMSDKCITILHWQTEDCKNIR